MEPDCRYDALFKKGYGYKQIFAWIYLYDGVAALVVTVQVIIGIMGQVNITESVNMLLLAIASGLVFIAINMPILFKFGSEKGRFVFIIAIGFVSGLGPIIKNIDSHILLNISNTLPIFLLGFAVIMNFISIFISMHIKIE